MTESNVWPTADELRPYRGRWVAIKEAKVIYAADSGIEIMQHLYAQKIIAASVFRVPENPREEWLGW